MKRAKEYNNKKIVLFYLFSFISIIGWFFFISVEINIKTLVNGNKISIQKEKKLPKNIYYNIRKISLTDTNLSKSIVLDVKLLSEDDETYLYEIIHNNNNNNNNVSYNKSSTFVNFYQLF